jgi:glutamyl-tRNA reductase
MSEPGVRGRTGTDRLLAVGISHRTAPLALLERLTLSSRASPGILAGIASHDEVREVVPLSTCNRTELYLVAADLAAARELALAALSCEGGIRPAALLGRLYSLRGRDAVRHLFRVTAGLESMAVGETEIQGQVKRAYELALREGATGPTTNRLFRGALEAGKRARRETSGCRPRVSVASVAVGLAAHTLGELAQRRAVVIGTGENGELTGRVLREHRARTVFVANRRYDRALALAQRFGARAVGLDDLRAELIEADVAVSCTSSHGRILGRDDLASVMEERGGRALVLVDTAMPRDIDPAVRNLPQVVLYDMDDLKREAAREVNPHDGVSGRASSVIDREVERFQEWLATRDVVPAISALRDRAEAVADQVLREQAACWESVSPEDRELVAMVAHAVVNRLLHEPTVRLKRVSGSPTSAAYVQSLRELFGLEWTVPGSAGSSKATRAPPSAALSAQIRPP